MNKWISFLSILMPSLCMQSMVFAGPQIESKMYSKLYPGEQLRKYSDFPSIIKFIKGNPTKPLIVFIPGTSNLARVAYGYPGADPKDFLSYWLHKQGYSFLAVSYPLGNSVFSKQYPNYSITNWANSIIENSKNLINKNSLSKNIVVVGWSLAGVLAPRLNTLSKKSGINIKLWIGLSAIQPMYNLIPNKNVLQIKPDKYGLANTQIFFGYFTKMLEVQNKLNKHIIIPRKIFLSQFIGNCPINILGTAIRYHSGKFIRNIQSAINDSNALKIDAYPPIASIHGDLSSDANFTMFSKLDWGSIITRQYAKKLENCKKTNKANYAKIISLIQSTPTLFTEHVKGSHYFFVGKYGAESTAKKINMLIKKEVKTHKTIKSLCNKDT